MEYQIWLNGEYFPRSEAKIGMTDRGFRLGDVLFDTSRTFNGKVFRLREHSSLPLVQFASNLRKQLVP